SMLGIIIFVFVFYFGYGTFRSAQKTFAAEVNGVTISLAQYSQSLAQMEDFYRRTFGSQLSPELLEQLGLKDRAIEVLIERALLMDYAQSKNINVSDEELNAAIKAQQIFFANGAFDQDRYLAILKANSLTHQQYKDEKRIELTLSKAQESLKDAANVTDQDVENEYRAKNTYVTCEYVAFKAEDYAAKAVVTEEKLAEFYAKEGEAFKTEEKRSARYVFFPASKYMAEVQPDEDGIKKTYQARAGLFYDEAAKRQKTLEEVRSQVVELYKLEKAHEKAYAAADNLLMDIEDKKTSWDKLSATTTPMVTRGENNPALPADPRFAAALFGISPSSPGEVFDTGEGVYLLSIAVAQPSEIPPLARVREQVRARFALEEGKKLAKEAAEKLSLKQIFPSVGGSYNVLKTESFNKKADSIPPIGASEKAEEAIFANPTAGFIPSSAFVIGDAAYIFKVVAVKLPEMIQLPSQSASIRQEL
ncbi:hypothetical protein FDZ71_08310, partial [bacterium]